LFIVFLCTILFLYDLNQALQLAAQAPDETMQGLLTQTQQMVQTQTQALAQTQSRLEGPAQEPLQQATQLLHRAGQEAAAGLQDPPTFPLATLPQSTRGYAANRSR